MRAYSDVLLGADIQSQETIASGLRYDETLTLNFLTDKSLIVFQKATLEKILAENKLPEVFSEFNVRYIMGYPEDLSEKIVGASEAQNIASDSITYATPETSPFKSWFMSLVK